MEQPPSGLGRQKDCWVMITGTKNSLGEESDFKKLSHEEKSVQKTVGKLEG